MIAEKEGPRGTHGKWRLASKMSKVKKKGRYVVVIVKEEERGFISVVYENISFILLEVWESC